MTRFRGMISTQPGSTPLASFKILSLDDLDGPAGCGAGTDIGKGGVPGSAGEVGRRREAGAEPRVFLPAGPFGERDEQQVFIQRVVPDACQVFVRLSSTGKR